MIPHNNNITKDWILVQIGANDGQQDDFMRKEILSKGLQAHLLEPIPCFYEELSKLYEGYDNVKCYNVAIHEHSGSATMNYVNSPELPKWTKGLGTFDESKNGFSMRGNFGLKSDLRGDPTMLKVNDLKERIQVKTLTLSDFLSNNKIEKIDIFVVDAEGFDGIIFAQLDLNKYRPTYIILETHTLGEEENKMIDNKLKNHGYTIVEKGWDTFAVKNDK